MAYYGLRGIKTLRIREVSIIISFSGKDRSRYFHSLARKQGEMARSDLQGSMKLSRLSSFPIKEEEESESGIRLSAFV